MLMTKLLLKLITLLLALALSCCGSKNTSKGGNKELPKYMQQINWDESEFGAISSFAQERLQEKYAQIDALHHTGEITSEKRVELKKNAYYEEIMLVKALEGAFQR
jgi:hypothetical protein